MFKITTPMISRIYKASTKHMAVTNPEEMPSSAEKAAKGEERAKHCG